MTAQTMPLADLLRDYRDGDEHGWKTEFYLLRSAHWAHLRNLRDDIAENGIEHPILIGDDGRIWDGHHRLCVAEMLGIQEVPIRYAKENR